MLADFVIANRDAIIATSRARVAARKCPEPSAAELRNGIPTFLDQLAIALRLAESSDLIDHEQIGRSAGRHGQDLLRMGLTVGQVVHDYGDVCQAITELAVMQKSPISAEEFRTLNLCLDDAIAGAVTVYSLHREQDIEDRGTERLGVLAHELRNLLNTATLAFESIRNGTVAVGGSTGLVLSRSLMGLRDVIDRSLADVRLDAGIGRLEPISVAELIEEVEIAALIQAKARGVQLTVKSVDPTVTVDGDRQVLAAALANLLHNAFKFTRDHSHISLTVRPTADRVLFEVEDECGGLPPGIAEDLFLPYEQRGSDRSGIGLGLSICLKAAKANGGEMHVRDLPGKGCVFTLDLPRRPAPPLTSVDGEKGASDASDARTRGVVARDSS
jgi:signal transduction histidine kinase